jgi:putative ABC transport system ATP-binding protein
MTTTLLPAASAVDATKVYGRDDTAVTALDHVSVAFESGRLTAIMGPSGSGKSTLVHAVAGLDTLTSGHVYIGETNLSELKDKDLTLLRRERVGFVFQSFNLIPTLTALENITLPIDLNGSKPDKAWLDSVVKTVGLADRLDHRPSELSGGQQQRVAVARALVGEPKLILADEPTGNLDTAHGEEVMRMLRQLNNEGSTIVMVTHSPAHADFASRVVNMLDGRILQEQRRAA